MLGHGGPSCRAASVLPSCSIMSSDPDGQMQPSKHTCVCPSRPSATRLQQKLRFLRASTSSAPPALTIKGF